MCRTCVQQRQVLDFAGIALDCTISRQPTELNKINYLARKMVIFEHLGVGLARAYAGAFKLGISQVLIAFWTTFVASHLSP